MDTQEPRVSLADPNIVQCSQLGMWGDVQVPAVSRLNTAFVCANERTICMWSLCSKENIIGCDKQKLCSVYCRLRIGLDTWTPGPTVASAEAVLMWYNVVIMPFHF